ncbi:MAG: NAD(P)-dependent oxidoreductase [Acidimicrobiia bacterium]
MRVLVTGAAGQVGHALAQACAGDDLIALDRAQLDVTDRALVHAVVAGTRPDAVIHAAAWTAVDACEDDPERAFRVNALGTRHVAEAARAAGAHLTYVSTDYVFDGELARPYHEWDAPNPRSVYGRSKLAGEHALDPDAAIVRISWVCGRHGSNMVKTILRLAAEHETLHFVDDQRGKPTFAEDVAPLIRRIAAERRGGVIHATNQGETTWFAFAQAVLAAAGADPGRVLPITTAQLDPPRPAPRPANSVLDNAVLRMEGIPLLPDHRESLTRLVHDLTA